MKNQKQLRTAVQKELKRLGCKDIEFNLGGEGFTVICTPPAHNTLSELRRIQFPSTCKGVGVTYMIF